MRLPQRTLENYLNRLEALISDGEGMPVRNVTVMTGGNEYLSIPARARQTKQVSWSEFVAWRTKSTSILDQLVPQGSLHRKTVDSFPSLECSPNGLQFGISFLKSIRDDLRDGFLSDLASQVEAELAGDYLGQAQRLLGDDASNGTRHIPAVVLAGAVLERGLKSLCSQLRPPEPLTSESGKPLTLAPLIETLKRRGVFDELNAKHLRLWAEIRNRAAHGDFDKFTKQQAEAMVTGVSQFLAKYL